MLVTDCFLIWTIKLYFEKNQIQQTGPPMRGFSFGWRWARFPKSSYIRPYIPTKQKGLTTNLIAMNPYVYWCRRDESNTRPSHYE